MTDVDEQCRRREFTRPRAARGPAQPGGVGGRHRCRSPQGSQADRGRPRRGGLGQADPHDARRHRHHPARRRRRPPAERPAGPGRRVGHPLSHLAPRRQARQRGGAGRPRRRRDQPVGCRRRDDRPRRSAGRRAPRPGADRARRAHCADRVRAGTAGVRRPARTRPPPRQQPRRRSARRDAPPACPSRSTRPSASCVTWPPRRGKPASAPSSSTRPRPTTSVPATSRSSPGPSPSAWPTCAGSPTTASTSPTPRT